MEEHQMRENLKSRNNE